LYQPGSTTVGGERGGAYSRISVIDSEREWVRGRVMALKEQKGRRMVVAAQKEKGGVCFAGRC
jgi:hypothetical protein